MESREKSSVLSFSLLAFLATVLGYAAAFCFQFGYLHSYDISYKFIEITTPLLIVSIAATVFLLMAFDSLSGAYKEIMTAFDFSNPTHRFVASFFRLAVIIWVPLTGIIVALGEASHQLVRTILFLILIYVLLALQVSIGPFLYHFYKEKNSKQAIISMYKVKDARFAKEKQKNIETYMEKYGHLFGPVFLILLIAAVAGRMFASNQNSMYVVQDNGSVKSVLILKTDNDLITKDFDVSNKSFKPGFNIVPLDHTFNFSQRIKVR